MTKFTEKKLIEFINSYNEKIEKFNKIEHNEEDKNSLREVIISIEKSARKQLEMERVAKLNPKCILPWNYVYPDKDENDLFDKQIDWNQTLMTMINHGSSQITDISDRTKIFKLLLKTNVRVDNILSTFLFYKNEYEGLFGDKISIGENYIVCIDEDIIDDEIYIMSEDPKCDKISVIKILNYKI